MSKEEIDRHLWPDSFVADGDGVNLVAELRDALGEDARNPRVIRTVQRFGYAFSVSYDTENEAAWSGESNVVFKLLSGDREILLQEGEKILGREREAIAWIDWHSVSRRHARIANLRRPRDAGGFGEARTAPSWGGVPSRSRAP